MPRQSKNKWLPRCVPLFVKKTARPLEEAGGRQQRPSQTTSRRAKAKVWAQRQTNPTNDNSSNGPGGTMAMEEDKAQANLEATKAEGAQPNGGEVLGALGRGYCL